MRLHVSLEPGVGETPSDFASRLATRACRDSLWEFCRDFRIDVQGLVDGKAHAVSALADLADVDPGPLMREAFVRADNEQRFLHKDQKLFGRNVTRNRLRVCPACLLEDVERSTFRISARPYRRSEWIVGAIHTCERHGLALVDLRAARRPGRSHETSIGLAEALPRLDHLHAQAVRRRPSAFETYLRARLAGKRSSPWLDAFPLYAVLDMARVVGAVSVHGREVTLDALDVDETRLAEAAGFDTLRHGEDGLRTLLADLQERFRVERFAWGPRAMFGRLYEWLAYETRDPVYEPVRQVMMDHFHGTLPVGAGDTMFGRNFGGRRLHSIHSASQEFGLHRLRLRKVLLAAGMIDQGARRVSDDRVLFDAADGARFIRQLADTLTLREAARYLNIPQPHDRLLFEAGFLRPFVRGGKAENLRGHVFRRRDLDAFLRKLTRDATTSEPNDVELFPLRSAAKRSCCGVVDIVRLILKRKLRTVAILPGETGFLSIAVDVAEVRPLVKGPDHGGLTVPAVKRELRTSNSVVAYLIEHGFLRGETVQNPMRNGTLTIVRPHELERFRAEYVTLYGLAFSRGVHQHTMRRELDAAGVRPVVRDTQVKLTLYRFADIP